MTPGDSSGPEWRTQGTRSADVTGSDLHSVTADTRHGSDIAADHVSMLNRHEWSYRVTVEVRAGREVRSDYLQAAYNLPDLGNATGSVFRELHHLGIIRPAGFARSTKKSRSGGLIVVWRAGDAA